MGESCRLIQLDCQAHVNFRDKVSMLAFRKSGYASAYNRFLHQNRIIQVPSVK